MSGFSTRRARVAVAALAGLATLAPAVAGWHVDYSPETNLEKLDVEALGRATRSIDMAAYVLTDVPVIEALAAAGVRGVRVRVYRETEERAPGATVSDAIDRLMAAPNVEVRWNPRHVIMHLKSYVVDGRTLRGGAANFSASGLKHQDNDRFETDDPAAIAAFHAAFEAAWAR